MARGTPRKVNGGAKSAKTADISTFFRTPSDQSKKPNGRSTTDIKPFLSSNGNSSKTCNPSATKTGKDKAIGGDTSADPVVISSDEEGEGTRSKRQKVVRSPPPVELVEVLDSSPGAGPSRLGSCSPPPRPVAGPALPPKPETARPAFEGVPDFQAPPTWPDIINTALDLEEEYDDGVNNGNSDNDADSQHPGMFDEDVADDGSDPGADVPGIEQPENENLGHARGGSIDLTMEWDEGDDEGMGMEEPDDYDDPPDRPSKRPGQRAAGEVGKCPVCDKSMKGKKDNVSRIILDTK
jgi:hypothetical protein